MWKSKLQGIMIGLVAGVLLTATAAYASDGATSIQVYFKSLRYVFDGVEKKTEQPGFIYNDTTYVPLRFVSEALGKKVHYNGDTGTISIGQRSYTEPPAMSIDPDKSYEATVETNLGSFTMELFAKDAPKTVNNFVFLAREGFYDEVIFHRIIQSFMIQTGDPTGTGRGGPGYKFADELNNGHTYEPGIVAMANAGPNTNGSQFFICTGAESGHLNQIPNYTIFGKITDGMDVVQQIAGTPVGASSTGERSKPLNEVKMVRVTVQEKE